MKKKTYIGAFSILFMLVALLAPHTASAVEAYLFLEVDGNWVQGESPVQSMDRESLIEVLGFGHSLFMPIGGTTEPGGVQGRTEHQPLSIVKPVDKSTPIIYRAMTQNEPVTRAEIRFFRPSPGGSGAEEHYYTIILENAYIVDITATAISSPDTHQKEIVSFTYHDITWTYESSGATHKARWGE